MGRSKRRLRKKTDSVKGTKAEPESPPIIEKSDCVSEEWTPAKKRKTTKLALKKGKPTGRKKTSGKSEQTKMQKIISSSKAKPDLKISETKNEPTSTNSSQETNSTKAN